MLGFGIIGYVLRSSSSRRAGNLALVLGPMMEKSLRTTLETPAADYAIFLDRPLSARAARRPVIVLGTLLFEPARSQAVAGRRCG